MWILFVPFVIAFLIIVGIILFVIRKWKVAFLIITIALLLNWLTECFPINVFCKDKRGELRLLSYNMMGCMGSESYINSTKDLTHLIELIDSIDADIVLLQEYYPISNKSFLDSMKVRYRYVELMDSLNTGKVVFSKYNMVVKNLLHESQTTIISMNIHSRDIELMNCYLQSNGISMVNSQIKCNSYMELLLNYYSNICSGYQVRYKQASEIGDYIKKNCTDVIVCGDLNDICGSETLRAIMGDKLKDAWWSVGYGYGNTYYYHHLYFRLDHCLFSPGLKPIGAKVIKRAKFSDHYPLVIDFDI